MKVTEGRRFSKGTAAMSALLLIAALLVVPVADSSAAGEYIVRETPGAGDGPETLVEQLGGEVLEQIGIIGGFAAELPQDAASALEADPLVVAVTPNAGLQLSSNGWDDASMLTGYDVDTYAGSMFDVTQVSGARHFWGAGYTGEGVDIALIDSGVAPVDGLTKPGKVINGPDLSFESQIDELRYMDTFGHGTHLAGIMAGAEDAVGDIDQRTGSQYFVGVAPDARIVSIKVAGATGATDVSQVLAAIDWVVQHRNDDGLNIRVLNLAFGTNGAQDYVLDPLAFAVEQAWNAGIVVVVSAGNDGNSYPLRNPAYDPFVIAVGSAEGRTHASSRTDYVSDFSNCGTSDRSVDIVARGRSLVSHRVPGSAIDVKNPQARVNGNLFLGSGTSQAAAVVSGAAALMIDRRPSLTPDQVKDLLIRFGSNVKRASGYCDDARSLELATLAEEGSSNAVQNHTPSVGTGSLEAARGDAHIELDGMPLVGEQDIFGNTWDGASWSTLSAAGASWSGGEWNGASWSGTSRSGASWSGASWSSNLWTGASWSGASWSSKSWSGASWSRASWSGASWSGASWSGNVWLGLSWQ